MKAWREPAVSDSRIMTPAFDQRIGALQRGHARDDLDVSLQRLIDEMELIGRPPDVGAARRPR